MAENRVIPVRSRYFAGAESDQIAVRDLYGGLFRSLTASYTLTANDHGSFFRSDAAGAITITVPVGLFEGFNVSLLQYGAGVVTIAAGAGATKRGAGTVTSQYNSVTIIEPVVDEFIVLGGA